MRLRTNTNPNHGPFHLRAPSKFFWRVVRGMLPHKTPRGAAALKRLITCDGVPPPFDRKRRQLVPAALRIFRLKPTRRFCKLADVLSKVGWSGRELIDKLESRRKERAFNYFRKKVDEKVLIDKKKLTVLQKMDEQQKNILARVGK